ncbi:MAG: hypothetical protein ACM3QY_09465 [Candidatus Levyibacteriota bacterium]
MKTLTRLATMMLAAAFCAPYAATSASAQESVAPSAAASRASLAASGMVVEGSVGILRAGGQLAVAAIRPLANASIIVLRDVANGSEASIRVASNVAQAASLAVGQTVSIVVEATGYSLIAAGRLVAFIPNRIGHALVHQAPSTQDDSTSPPPRPYAPRQSPCGACAARAPTA